MCPWSFSITSILHSVPTPVCNPVILYTLMCVLNSVDLPEYSHLKRMCVLFCFNINIHILLMRSYFTNNLWAAWLTDFLFVQMLSMDLISGIPYTPLFNCLKDFLNWLIGTSSWRKHIQSKITYVVRCSYFLEEPFSWIQINFNQFLVRNKIYFKTN